MAKNRPNCCQIGNIFVEITCGKVHLWFWKRLQMEKLWEFFSPTLWPPCGLSRRQCLLLNHICTTQGLCAASRKHWNLLDDDTRQVRVQRSPGDVSHCQCLSSQEAEWWPASSSFGQWGFSQLTDVIRHIQCLWQAIRLRRDLGELVELLGPFNWILGVKAWE